MVTLLIILGVLALIASGIAFAKIGFSVFSGIRSIVQALKGNDGGALKSIESMFSSFGSGFGWVLLAVLFWAIFTFWGLLTVLFVVIL